MAWGADSIMGVSFNVLRPNRPDALAIWNSLFPGVSPDSFQRAGGTQGFGMISTAAGIIGDNQVTLNCQIGRTDIVVQGNPGDAENDPPQLADYHRALAEVAEYVSRVAADDPGYRLALVANLSLPAPEEGAWVALNELCPFARFPAGSSDCAFQFNLRKAFHSDPNVAMNRICTWASGQKQLMAMNLEVGAERAPPASGPMMVRSLSTANLKVDTNTMTSIGWISPQPPREYLAEMVEQILILSDRGYPELGHE